MYGHWVTLIFVLAAGLGMLSLGTYIRDNFRRNILVRSWLLDFGVLDALARHKSLHNEKLQKNPFKMVHPLRLQRHGHALESFPSDHWLRLCA